MWDVELRGVSGLGLRSQRFAGLGGRGSPAGRATLPLRFPFTWGHEQISKPSQEVGPTGVVGLGL